MRLSTNVQSVLLLLGSLYFVSHIDLTEARGGRGGGGRGGSRGGGGRYGGSRSRTGSGVRNSRGYSSRTAFKAALVAGMIYGSRRYMRRRTYIDDPEYEPTICTNYNLKDENGTSWGKFICPMYNQQEDQEWCCGSDNEEYCCTYWEDAGRAAGTIIGIIIGVLIVGAVIFFCCCKGKNRFSSSKTRRTANEQYTAQYSASATAAPAPGGEKAGIPPDNPLPYPTTGATAPSLPYPEKGDAPPPQYGFSTNVQPPPYGVN